MQGGIDPDLPGTAYFDLAREVKRRAPAMHVHALSPMEIVNGATRSGLSIREWLTEAQNAGLGSIPGTAAEILDDEVRWVLTKGKLPTAAWIEVVTTAHEVGLRSSSTMMYGHVDTPAHWVAHLKLLARLQDRTGGFTEFVPLPFVHHSAPLNLAGVARPGPTARDNLAVHAMARLLLHGRIDNIQTSWVKVGVEGTRAMLRAGVNDLGGTLMEETISRMAGSEHGSAKSPSELEAIAGGIGRPVRQRTTTYGVPDRPGPGRCGNNRAGCCAQGGRAGAWTLFPDEIQSRAPVQGEEASDRAMDRVVGHGLVREHVPVDQGSDQERQGLVHVEVRRQLAGLDGEIQAVPHAGAALADQRALNGAQSVFVSAPVGNGDQDGVEALVDELMPHRGQLRAQVGGEVRRRGRGQGAHLLDAQVVQQSDPVRPQAIDRRAAYPRDLGDPLLSEGLPAFLHEDDARCCQGPVPAPLHPGVDLAGRAAQPILGPPLVGHQVRDCHFRHVRDTTSHNERDRTFHNF